METIPALQLDGDQLAGAPVGEEVQRWVEAGFAWLQLKAGAAGGSAGLAEAVTAAHPECNLEVMVGCADRGPAEQALSAGADRILLDLTTATQGDVIAGLIATDPNRVAVDLPVHDEFLHPEGILGADLPGAVETLSQWGARRIVLNFARHTEHLPEATEDFVAAALGATDAEVLIRVAPVRAQDLHRLADRIPRPLTGVVIDPAESPLQVAEEMAGLLDRVDLWSPAMNELKTLPGTVPPWEDPSVEPRA